MTEIKMQNYVDYFKCIEAKGEDYAPCNQFRKAYRSLCPGTLLEKWEEAREAGWSPHFPKPAQDSHHH